MEESGSASAVPNSEAQRRLDELEEEYQKRTARLEELYRDAAQYQLGLTISDGREIRIPLRSDHRRQPSK